MKKITTLFLTLAFISSAYAGTTLRYYNKDSKDQNFKVTTCGNHTDVTFSHSTTSSVTIQGCSDAVISTSCGDVKVKDGDKVVIQDGCVKVVSSL